MRKDAILPSSISSPQKRVDNEWNGAAVQLRRPLACQELDGDPVGGAVTLFLREDLTEPESELVDRHACDGALRAAVCP